VIVADQSEPIEDVMVEIHENGRLERMSGIIEEPGVLDCGRLEDGFLARHAQTQSSPRDVGTAQADIHVVTAIVFRLVDNGSMETRSNVRVRHGEVNVTHQDGILQQSDGRLQLAGIDDPVTRVELGQSHPLLDVKGKMRIFSLVDSILVIKFRIKLVGR
jgi:hypothetical protein